MPRTSDHVVFNIASNLVKKHSNKAPVQVVRVAEVINLRLWEDYRTHLQRATGAPPADDPLPLALAETWLFHGTTRRNIQQITQEGFDWRLSGLRVGAKSESHPLPLSLFE